MKSKLLNIISLVLALIIVSACDKVNDDTIDVVENLACDLVITSKVQTTINDYPENLYIFYRTTSLENCKVLNTTIVREHEGETTLIDDSDVNTFNSLGQIITETLNIGQIQIRSFTYHNDGVLKTITKNQDDVDLYKIEFKKITTKKYYVGYQYLDVDDDQELEPLRYSQIIVFDDQDNIIKSGSYDEDEDIEFEYFREFEYDTFNNLISVSELNELITTLGYSSIIDTDSYLRVRTFGTKKNYNLSISNRTYSSQFYGNENQGVPSYHVSDIRANENEYEINEDGYYIKETRMTEQFVTHIMEYFIE
jgi:hypothetical protein